MYAIILKAPISPLDFENSLKNIWVINNIVWKDHKHRFWKKKKKKFEGGFKGVLHLYYVISWLYFECRTVLFEVKMKISIDHTENFLVSLNFNWIQLDFNTLTAAAIFRKLAKKRQFVFFTSDSRR